MKRILVTVSQETRRFEREPLELLVHDWSDEGASVQVDVRVGRRWMPVDLLGGEVKVER